ncbi:YbbM seven transmembrane helix protein [Methylophaga frappieri]|uniref:YbbM seven transmembrane helix protein n=1 Tax=Methylophaga frappieri (strain ATCC BAA-2434 / DSM 25690 / JAM7) TaxID=754477 RepID=I1YEE6_METFJ|nr:ABC transporter permease [Methylophaga frappieri]AFJ01289.1 YbbM seven transmembrane helix protein [Methylophaga frappieri]
MSQTVAPIPMINLAIAFIPVLLVFVVLIRWTMDWQKALIAVSRMLVQLLLVGYLLSTIFAAEQAGIVMLVMLVMVGAASWIALNTTTFNRKNLLAQTFLAILVGGGVTLALVTQGVIQLDPWFQPSYMIPLAGMIFANAMNCISLAVERLHNELQHGVTFDKARIAAFQAAFIPQINALLAVGLVSLPGMMTGQILSGVSPVIAAQYQIVVMCMIFGSAGLSTALFLTLSKAQFTKTATAL